MNKPVLYIILFLSFAFSAQENLIYNGDFELYSDCPVGFSDPFQNPKEIEKCLGWKAPTYGTSDYFNVCSVSSNVSVPSNGIGVQLPYNGNGYLGGFLCSFQGGTGDDGYSGVMWWEYIQGQLIQPLEKGHIYSLSMRVSLAEYVDLMVNEFGAYFSKNTISSPNTASLALQPQCIFYNPDFFMDSINWVKVQSTFVADGGEKYITIGNFKNNIDTDTLRRVLLDPPLVFSYMYYDAVELFDVTEQIEVSNVFTPNEDGINDLWLFPFSSENEIITIYNRWGNAVYTSKLINFSWNGKSNEGKECTNGVYFYTLSETNKTGFIQLIR